MDQQQLKNILELHRKWVLGEDGGSRADLSSADLSSADLRFANLSSADLSSADLRSANLSSADLRSANLSSANLSSANLRFADLRSADLRSANLRFADLRSADLRSANLSSANLSSADLSSADLSSADLSSADLRSANLRSIKEDFYKILAVAKDEVLCLYDALMKGKVDGSTYEQDGCGCLVGTIALCRKEHYKCMTIDLIPDSNRPAERWFLGIELGDLPQSNPISEVTAEWCREWLDEHEIKYPRYEIVAIKE